MKNISLAILTLLLFSCKKTQPPMQPITHPQTGQFSFNFNSKPITGIVLDCILVKESTGWFLSMSGNSGETEPQTVFQVFIKMPFDKPATGSYTTADLGNYIHYNSKYAPNSYHYYTSFPISDSKIAFNVVSYNETTKEVSCTFSGNMQDEISGSLYNITNGTMTGIIK